MLMKNKFDYNYASLKMQLLLQYNVISRKQV